MVLWFLHFSTLSLRPSTWFSNSNLSSRDFSLYPSKMAMILLFCLIRPSACLLSSSTSLSVLISCSKKARCKMTSMALLLSAICWLFLRSSFYSSSFKAVIDCVSGSLACLELPLLLVSSSLESSDIKDGRSILERLGCLAPATTSFLSLTPLTLFLRSLTASLVLRWNSGSCSPSMAYMLSCAGIISSELLSDDSLEEWLSSCF